MIVESVGMNETIQLNPTNHTTIMKYLDDGAQIESPYKIVLTLFAEVGNNVTIALGRDSVLIIPKGVKIGKHFVARIKGGRKARIMVEDLSDIPADAELQPQPE